MAHSEHLAEFGPEAARHHPVNHAHHLPLCRRLQHHAKRAAHSSRSVALSYRRIPDILDDVTEIRVLIADDEELMRSALAIFVERSPSMTVLGTAEDGAVAVDMAERLRPDVVLMDLNMPRIDGFEAAQRLQRAGNPAQIIAITTLGTTDAITRALRGGFAGYLLKDSPPDAVVAAIAAVHSGSGVLSPEMTKRLVLDVKRHDVIDAHSVESLNDREAAILRELALGKSNSEIADALHLSESTVKTHLGVVMKKWDVRDRVQVLITAVRAGLVDLFPAD
ncbi:response regulator transcription factor [Microbacterium sp. 1262]|uniref:response regulator transcription factor n=1 Tax=Microbacterium sp. 1262 TaxID=3156415 RepID=UPI003399429D